ncbi:Protein flowering locus D [Vitis vinifera]|uniref:Protein flowering locus D n=1 Tax=Vitis vinifera TaxID=29760 RepID=A0A438DU59_VITVI|nr:Protein flowering locus D [Vitis vinifera]
MDPTNQISEFSSFPPLPLDPLQYTIFVPHSNPNPNNNPHPSSNTNSNPISNPNPNPNPDPVPNSNHNPYPDHFLSLSIPRKRRRGRPRSAATFTPSQNQVFQIPHTSNGTINGNNYLAGASSSSTSFSKLSIENPTSSTAAVPDISDEIIVINKEATSEALIALSAGFPADSLTEEEIDAGVLSIIGGIEQVNYILIRNHILAKWRENVSSWVAKEMFLGSVPSHCHILLDSAYNFLVTHGYVNFGVAHAIKEKIPTEPSKQNVVVIGAGLAGLAAARQLMRFGCKVTVLEGRKRAGGRVYTKKMEGGNRTAAADLGGSVLTGTHGNPLGIVARQLGYHLHKVRDKCPLYSVDGKPVDPDMDLKVEADFNRLLDKASKLRQLMGEVSVDVSLGAALETFRQVFAFKAFTCILDQDDPYDMGGDHCFLPGGNGRLVQVLSENVPILYEKTVHTIRYGSDGVQVIAGNQVFEGDMALCTVPLGVLKSGSIKFIPELPQRKLDGIKRLGFGLLNKVAMLFPHVFWGTDLDTFGHLSDDPSRRGEFFLFYSYATVAGGPLLIALVAGEAAHKFESMPPTDAVTWVIQILRGIYEPQGINVPEPIQTVCTRWGSDPFSLGSYSNVAVGASGDDYDILAENVGDGRLFFAGEATTRRYPATMHGAFLSGLREAANMAHYANARVMRIKIERSPSKNAHSCASLLADLFREPDLEFGSFAVIFGKKNSDPKSMQLESHFNHQQQLHIYTLLSRQQALELREVRGGDDMRLNFLCEKLGVKTSCKKRWFLMEIEITFFCFGKGMKPKAAGSKRKVVRKAKVVSNVGGLMPRNSNMRNGNSSIPPSNLIVRNGSGSTPPPNLNMGNGSGLVPRPNLNMGNGSGLVPSSNLNMTSGLLPPSNLSIGNGSGFTPANLNMGNNGSSVPPDLNIGNGGGSELHPHLGLGNDSGVVPPPNINVAESKLMGQM